MTVSRPRLTEDTDDKLKNIKDELRHMKNEENKDVSKYEGKMKDIKEDEVINEALDALQERGYKL